MRRSFSLATLIVAGLAAACAAAGAGSEPGPRATLLKLGNRPFRDPQVMIAMSMPPQFDLMLTRDMPTPGWNLTLDSIEVDEETGRIVAKVSEIRPTGITTQVITATPCLLQLGTLGSRRYVLEIWLRRGTSGTHSLAQALVVIAR